MDCSKYLDKNKEIQKILLNFLENEEKIDARFHNLLKLFNSINIQNVKHALSMLFHLVTKIGNNHHRIPLFFEKIEKIIKIFQKDIKKYYSNSEIFNIFKSNKRLLLFLIEEKIIILNNYIVKKITQGKYIEMNYPQYFSPEIKPFINEKWFLKNVQKELVEEIKKELPDGFFEKRKKGENDGYICKLIQNDSVEDFVSYVTKNNYSLISKIVPSIYETNSFLMKNREPSLIEYAAFFGSIEIFQFLRFNNVDLTQSLWIYTIHGNNPEIIHLLEENLEKSNIESYKKFAIESIKCYHNNIANYFLNNYLHNEDKNVYLQSLKYYNFDFISNNLVDQSSFAELCKYDYYFLIRILLDNADINAIKIIINMFNII